MSVIELDYYTHVQCSFIAALQFIIHKMDCKCMLHVKMVSDHKDSLRCAEQSGNVSTVFQLKLVTTLPCPSTKFDSKIDQIMPLCQQTTIRPIQTQNYSHKIDHDHSTRQVSYHVNSYLISSSTTCKNTFQVLILQFCKSFEIPLHVAINIIIAGKIT